MPWFTGLARVARTTGYPVVEWAGWKTRGHGPMLGGKAAGVHHTAGPLRGNYPSLNTVVYGRPGLPGPLAQYGIGRDGTIYVFAAGLAYHAGAVKHPNFRNSYNIGIEAENNGLGEVWPVAQLDAYVKLCRALIDEFGLPLEAVAGHKEFCAPSGRKTDPNFRGNGIDMDDFRAAVKRGYWITPELAPVADNINELEDDMPLSDADVERIAAAVERKLQPSWRDLPRLVWGYMRRGDTVDASQILVDTREEAASANRRAGLLMDGQRAEEQGVRFYGAPDTDKGTEQGA